MKSLAINANGNAITSFAREQPYGVRGVYIYIHKLLVSKLLIYIYIYISNFDTGSFYCPPREMDLFLSHNISSMY